MAHAKRAMSEYDQSEQWGMRIRIEMSNAKGSGKTIELGDKPRLFIGGLKEEVEDSQLKELFENVGPVTDVFVAKGKGQSVT